MNQLPMYSALDYISVMMLVEKFMLMQSAFPAQPAYEEELKTVCLAINSFMVRFLDILFSILALLVFPQYLFL